MEVTTAFQSLAISLGLGLLVGMQRERVNAPLAGVRTFALITLLGTLTGLLALRLGPWLVGAGFLGVTAVTAAGNLVYARNGHADAGITTEIAILVMYGIGAALVFGPPQIAVVPGGGVAVLLYSKPIMHGFVKRLGEPDIRAIMQFVLITLVILPVLPDRTFGPLDVLNLREIWSMVVLVVGISLVGYVAFKLYGGSAGILLVGLIGGVISSTATTVSHARGAARAEGKIAAATIVILVATSVMYARVLIEVFVVARETTLEIGPPIAILLVVSLASGLALWLRSRDARVQSLEHHNPTAMKTALVFGALYAVVIFAVAAARHYLGERSVLVAGAISGLTDMDAITLTSARMASTAQISARIAWQAIVIAAMANLVFKCVVVAMVGGQRLALHIAMWFALQFTAGLAMLLLWPWPAD